VHTVLFMLQKRLKIIVLITAQTLKDHCIHFVIIKLVADQWTHKVTRWLTSQYATDIGIEIESLLCQLTRASLQVGRRRVDGDSDWRRVEMKMLMRMKVAEGEAGCIDEWHEWWTEPVYRLRWLTSFLIGSSFTSYFHTSIRTKNATFIIISLKGDFFTTEK